MKLRECMDIVSQCLARICIANLYASFSSPSGATSQLLAQLSREAAQPSVSGRRAFDEQQLAPGSAAQPYWPARPLAPQLVRPRSLRWCHPQLDPGGTRQGFAQRTRKPTNRFARSVAAHERLDRPKLSGSEQTQIGKVRLAIDDKPGKDPKDLLALCHQDHPQSTRFSVCWSTGCLPPSPQPRRPARGLAARHGETVPLALIPLQPIEAVEHSAANTGVTRHPTGHLGIRDHARAED